MNTSSLIAIVTGGSRGLGRSTVISLAERGVHSIFTYRSNRTEAEKTASLAREAGAKAVALQLDTGNIGAFDDFVAAVRKTLQGWRRERFDYLVSTTPEIHSTSTSTKSAKRTSMLWSTFISRVSTS